MRVMKLEATCCVLGLLLAATASTTRAEDRMLPPIGGPGGSAFVARCPPGQILRGLEMRTGDDIDAIRPLCSKPTITVERRSIEPGNPAYDPDRVSQYENYDQYGYTDPVATTGWFGGAGGSVRRIVSDQPVSGIYAEAEGVNTVTLNGIALVVYRTMRSSPVVDESEVAQIKERMRWGGDADPATFRAPLNHDAQHRDGSSMCPAGDDGWTMQVVGIHGRTGEFVDAIGLVCGNAEAPKRPLALGRVQGSTPAPPPDRIGGEPVICAYARSARTRNSPAAPGLEAQCEAARRALPPVVLGRVQAGGPAPPINTLNGEPPICAHARDARQRQSPAAPSLERQCDAARAQVVTLARSPSEAAALHAGIVVPPPAAPAPPAAPVAPPPAEPPHAFLPPMFDDGARLWACADLADGDANGAACQGLESGAAYCRLRGFSGALQMREDGSPDLAVAPAQPDIAVHAVSGDACMAGDCAVVIELHCAP